MGRVGEASFDYSPAWIRKSVQRSLQRLRTDYLDVVYCHDVEFVSSADQVVEAVKELRRLRDQRGGLVRYIGISGYPVHVLVDLAERILHDTGEPLDVVMSYANYTLQNIRLLHQGLRRLVDRAGVDVVLNASPLGMGLLRRDGVPVGGMGDFHPAPTGLRDAVQKANEWLVNNNNNSNDGKIEVLAIRFALGSWLRHGAEAGAMGLIPFSAITRRGKRLGGSVLGVSNLDELYETLNVWREAINGLDDLDHILTLAQGIREVLGPWFDYTWPSPPLDFVNSLSPEHLALKESMPDLL